MKRIIRLLVLACTCLSGLSYSAKQSEKNNSKEEVLVRSVSGEREDTMTTVFNRWDVGGGSVVNSNGASSGAAGGGGGTFLTWLFLKWLESQGTTSVVTTYTDTVNNATANADNAVATQPKSVSIRDVYDNPEIKKDMEDYGWTEERMSGWLTKMIDTSLDNFFDDDDIKVYLGSGNDLTNKYYSFKDLAKGHYTFHLDSTQKWNNLVAECASYVGETLKYDAVWVLNETFLQCAIVKDATFVLVTPSKEFYDMSMRKTIKQKDKEGKEYEPFYSKELYYINHHGYLWTDEVTPLVEVRSNNTSSYA